MFSHYRSVTHIGFDEFQYRSGSFLTLMLSPWPPNVRTANCCLAGEKPGPLWLFAGTDVGVVMGVALSPPRHTTPKHTAARIHMVAAAVVQPRIALFVLAWERVSHAVNGVLAARALSFDWRAHSKRRDSRRATGGARRRERALEGGGR
jgi:hypothetical protein